MIKNQGLKVLDSAFTTDGDGHCHIFDLSQGISVKRRYNPQNTACKKTLIALLKKHHIHSALLSQPSFLGTNNTQILEAIKWAQEQKDENAFTFRGVAAIEPTMPFEQMQEFKNKGIIGIRLNLIGEENLAQYTHKTWQNVYKNLAQLNWHLEVYCQCNRIDKLFDFWLEHCPQIVFDHFALPQVDEPLGSANFQKLLQSNKSQVMVKITGTYRLFPTLTIEQANEKAKHFYHLLLEHLGQDRLIWGSDWPWTQFENHLNFKDCLDWHYWNK